MVHHLAKVLIFCIRIRNIVIAQIKVPRHLQPFSKNELNRLKDKLAEIKLFPMYGKDYYTAEKFMYMQDRVQFLQKITEAIAAAEQDATPEERQLLYLKFWHARPRPTDDVIAEKLNISRTTMYRLVNGICRKIGARLGTDL